MTWALSFGLWHAPELWCSCLQPEEKGPSAHVRKGQECGTSGPWGHDEGHLGGSRVHLWSCSKENPSIRGTMRDALGQGYPSATLEQMGQAANGSGHLAL